MNNTKSKDNGGRLIFENATLCSQFLREYTGMDLFKDIEPGDVEDMTERYLRNINLPDDEIYELTDKIKEGDMNRLFEHFEGYDIQKVRRESRAEGYDTYLITLIHKKLERGKSPETIADEVEESIETVNQVVEAIESINSENFDAQKVLEAWKKTVTI